MNLTGLLITLMLLALIWELAWGLTDMKRLGPRELRQRLESGWRPLLLDVRTPREYAWFHISGSVNAPFGSAELDAALELHSRTDGNTTPVVIICMTGHRSTLTAWNLQRTGLVEIHDLMGGMVGWRLTGGPVVSGSRPQ
ncbi:MAG: rhodanese-like domain-containing protein [Desulfovibrio sp.]